MSAVINHHKQSPKTNVPVNSTPHSVITSATWSNSPTNQSLSFPLSTAPQPQP
ncbi:hypothetical protein PtB15_13B73 [Puccinia triticina]|nr:hypothetical protein PtB15_13B73 [Puccinia triticina]